MTQSFSADIKNIPPLQEDEEDVSYDVESLFTNITINETIDYVLDILKTIDYKLAKKTQMHSTISKHI